MLYGIHASEKQNKDARPSVDKKERVECPHDDEIFAHIPNQSTVYNPSPLCPNLDTYISASAQSSTETRVRPARSMESK